MASKTLQFDIATPERIVLSEKDVQQVSLPSEMGQITILPGHIPVIANLVAGEIIVIRNGKEEYMACSGGFIQVTKEKVIILADTAELESELVLEEIEKAKNRAQKLLSEKRSDEVHSVVAIAGMERELARYRVAVKRRKVRSHKTISTE